MAAGGGGAWKVAYADFVTAMMAFFLVMWICAQDQQVKRAVSYYFNDPFGTSKVDTSRKPKKGGAVAEGVNTGSVPQSESVAQGRGRTSYTILDETCLATKLVSDWLHRNKRAYAYWREQATHQREVAAASKTVTNVVGIEELASKLLSKQLQVEFGNEAKFDSQGFSQDLLIDVVSKVNWTQIADDLLTE